MSPLPPRNQTTSQLAWAFGISLHSPACLECVSAMPGEVVRGGRRMSRALSAVEAQQIVADCGRILHEGAHKDGARGVDTKIAFLEQAVAA